MNGNVGSPNQLTTLLSQIGFNPLLPLSQKQIKYIEIPQIELLKNSMNKKEIEVKLNYIIFNLLQLFNINTTVLKIHSTYTEMILSLTKINPPIIPFFNHLILFDYVISKFNKDFLTIDIDILFEEKIVAFMLEDFLDLKSINTFKNNIKEQSKTDPLIKYLFLYFLSTMCHKMDYGFYTFDSFIHNINAYNQFYISNYKVSIMLHIQMLIYLKVFYKENNRIETISNRGRLTQSKAVSITKKKRPLSSVKCKERTNNDDNKKIGTIFVFLEDEIGVIPSIQFYTCQNILKLCFNSQVNQLSYQFSINIMVVNVDFFLQKRLVCSFFPYSTNIQIKNYPQNQSLILKTSLLSIFKYFTISNLTITLENVNNPQVIKDIFIKYEGLITKANSFNIQEDINESTEYYENQSTKSIANQWSILHLIILQMIKIKDKKIYTNFAFSFSFFKLTISKSNMSKEIQLFFNYSNIGEKPLLGWFKTAHDLAAIIDQITSFIILFESYKNYTIVIRISQTNFQSYHLTFAVNLVTKCIINYLEERKIKNIMIYEKSHAHYDSTMEVYIKDPHEKNIKKLIANLSQVYSKITHPLFKFLKTYMQELAGYFDIIIFLPNELNTFKILRTYDDNKIFFTLKKKKPKNKDYISPLEEEESHVVEMIIYMSNKKEIYENTLRLMKMIRSNPYIRSSTYRVVLIFDKYFLDYQINTAPNLKQKANVFYDNIEDFYLIAKQNESSFRPEFNLLPQNDSNEISNNNLTITNIASNIIHTFNYDVLILDECISIINYTRYDPTDDDKYTHFIYEFISVLSDCLELTINVLKNKNTYGTSFRYIFRLTTDDYYYVFIYNIGKIFFKRLDTFDSLMNLSLKNAKPLLCFLFKKRYNAYTDSNENFFDIFVNMFLNLHKVLDTQESLNTLFFQKLHKKIFDSDYDQFFPVCFEYKVYKILNDFFMSNDYLSINQNQKFKKCFIIPFDYCPKNKAERSINGISENVFLFNFDFPTNYWNLNKELCYFSLDKTDKIIEELDFMINKKNHLVKVIYSCLLKKGLMDNSARIIMQMYISYDSKGIDLTSGIYENIIKEFVDVKKKIKSQRADMKIIHKREINRRNENIANSRNARINHNINATNSCIIF